MAYELTDEQLAEIMVGAGPAKIAAWGDPLRAYMALYEIDETIERMSVFLASVANETGELKATKEVTYYNTDYYYARDKVFGSARMPPKALFDQWRAEGPDAFYTKFFDWVYDDRRVNIGLGNLQDGDGSKYVGRGVGLTGRANYARYGRVAGIDLINNPDLLLEPKWAALTIAAMWKDVGNNERADRGDFFGAFKALNPGGSVEFFKPHMARFERALRVLRKNPKVKPKPMPVTKTDAAKQAVSGKTGVSNVIAGVAATVTIADVVSKTGEIQGAVTVSKGLFASLGIPTPYAEIVLSSIVVLCVAFNVARYAVKLWRGEAQSS